MSQLPAMTSKNVRIEFIVHAGSDDRHTGDAGNVRNRMMHADVLLIETFLRVADPTGAFVHHHIAFADEGAQAADPVGGPKRPGAIRRDAGLGPIGSQLYQSCGWEHLKSVEH